MASFTSRFKRVTASGSAKRYIDRNTGETISYRQAMNRAKAGELTRKAPTPFHQARVNVGIKRRQGIRAVILEQRGLTGADERKDPKLARYIKQVTRATRPGSRGLARENLTPEEIKAAREDYEQWEHNPVGGFIRV
jgi:hypothetical protein